VRVPTTQDEPDFLDLDASPSSGGGGPSSAPMTQGPSSATIRGAYPSPPPSPPLSPPEETTLPTKEVPFAVDPEKANMPAGMRATAADTSSVPFPNSAGRLGAIDDVDLPVDSALDAAVEAEVLRSYSEPPEPAAHPTLSTGGGGGPSTTATGINTTGESSASTHFAKSLRLSSSQLKALGLKKGANTVTFSVSSSYSGVATCSARIFLWDAEDHIVISDIDGTITKCVLSPAPLCSGLDCR
jgi:hypothetical protein